MREGVGGASLRDPRFGDAVLIHDTARDEKLLFKA